MYVSKFAYGYTLIFKDYLYKRNNATLFILVGIILP